VFNIAQTNPHWVVHKTSVSETWFHYKAEQCAQLAKDAANPMRRSLLEEQGRLWLQIAAAEMRQEERREKAHRRKF
jgi:hypothetical protein